MSWQQVEGRWRQFLADAKLRWGKLTDDDFAECEANRDKLIGKLQQLYGMDKEEANREIATIEQSLDDAQAGAERMYGGNKAH